MSFRSSNERGNLLVLSEHHSDICLSLYGSSSEFALLLSRITFLTAFVAEIPCSVRSMSEKLGLWVFVSMEPVTPKFEVDTAVSSLRNSTRLQSFSSSVLLAP